MAAVPVADPLRMTSPERRAVRAAVDDVLEQGPLVLGPWVSGFEEDFAAYLDPATRDLEVIGVGNGSDALTIALLALAVPPRSDVLVAANDGGFAASAARAAGLVPVATDADAVTGLTSVAALERAFTSAVAAVVVTHLHGQPAPLERIADWCRERGLVLVEDAAQAHGALLGGRRVGSLADAATFSFYPTKNLGALGDGGAVVTRDPEAAVRARQLRQYGWQERFRVGTAGGRNSRLDALQAAVLSARLPFLDEANARRREIVARYRAALVGTDTDVVGDSPGAVAHHAVLVHPERDRLVEVLARHGVDSCVHYPWLITEMPGLQLTPAATPEADLGRRRKVSLPCFPTMTADEVERVAAALTEWGHAGG